MALADDIVRAAERELCCPGGVRDAVAAVLDTLAEHTARRAQDLLAQGIGYAWERDLQPHEMREIAEAIRAEVKQP